MYSTNEWTDWGETWYEGGRYRDLSGDEVIAEMNHRGMRNGEAKKRSRNRTQVRHNQRTANISTTDGRIEMILGRTER